MWLFGLCVSVMACGSSAVTERTAAASAAPAPRAAVLTPTPEERRLLDSGQAVHRERYLTPGDGRYLGTVSFELVKARPSTILAAFSRPEALPELLPKTKRAVLVDARGPVQRVELVQGNSWIDAGYTVVLERESDKQVRFWLDRSLPHDIDDAWGYFHVEPFDPERTLVTVAVAVDIGSGLVRALFANIIQRYIDSTPGLIKRYAEQWEADNDAGSSVVVATVEPS